MNVCMVMFVVLAVETITIMTVTMMMMMMRTMMKTRRRITPRGV